MAITDLLIDDVEGTPGDVKKLVDDLTESIHEDPTGKKPESKETPRPEYIEEKYWTGDVEESLKKQHQGFKDLQRAHGQMANDLGVQRRLADELIGLKRLNDLQGAEPPQNEPAPLPKITASSLLEKPDAALDEYLSAREARLADQYNSRLAALEAELQGVRLQSKHGDYSNLANDPEWKEFLTSDPYRTHLAQLAAAGDEVVAEQLITQYREVKKSVSKPDPAPEPTALRAGEDKVDEAAAAALARAASPAPSSKGKIHSRAALMRLKAQHPEVYEDPAFQQEILLAYSQGRVK